MNFVLLKTQTALMTAAESAEAIVTPYTNTTVPVINMVMEVLVMVLVIGAAIAAGVLLYLHVKEWAHPLFIGLGSYLLFSYALGQGVRWLFSFWVQKSEWAADNVEALSFVLMGVSFVGSILTVVLGMLYLRRSEIRLGKPMTFGGTISFGFAIYIGMILTNGFVPQVFQMFNNSRYINSMGFDGIASAYVQQGLAEETVIKGLLDLVEAGPILYFQLFLTALNMIFETAVFISAALVLYGVLTGKLEKKHVAFTAVMLIAAFIPSMLTFLSDGSDVYLYIISGFDLLAAACSVACVVVLAKKYMQEDLVALSSYSRTKEKEAVREESRKMPKINMPKD